MSASVVDGARLIRIVAVATSSGRFIAASTCERAILPDEQAAPAGWEWLPLPDGPGPYRLMWQRLVGSHPVYRPARKL